MSFDFEKQFAGKHVVSLGQSFSWPVFVLGEIRERLGKQADINYLPFSGKTLTYNKDVLLRSAELQIMRMRLHTGEISFSDIYNGRVQQREITPDEKSQLILPLKYERFSQVYLPTCDDLKAYYSYLSERAVGMSDFVQRREETGQQTVMLEKVCGGSGFLSFYSLWVARAQELGLEEEIKDAGFFRPENIEIEGGVKLDYPLVIEETSDTKLHTIQAFSQDNRLGEDSSRLVDYYSLCRDNPLFPPTPQVAQNSENLDLIKSTLRSAIDRVFKRDLVPDLSQAPQPEGRVTAIGMGFPSNS